MAESHKSGGVDEEEETRQWKLGEKRILQFPYLHLLEFYITVTNLQSSRKQSSYLQLLKL